MLTKRLFDPGHVNRRDAVRYCCDPFTTMAIMENETAPCPHRKPVGLPCIQCCLSDVFERTGQVPAKLLQLVDHIYERTLPKGEQLYREGDHAHALLIINHGLIKLTQTLANGQQRIVRLLHGGDIIGLESLVNHQARHTATAIVASHVCELPTALILQLESMDPQVYERLMVQWQRSLDEADSFITELSTGTAEARLARLLMKLSGGGNAAPFPSLTREDIGSIIGVSTETASRMMARFKREGFLQERGDELSCREVGALMRLAQN